MAKLTPEEFEELRSLEKAEKDRLEEEEAAALRQHLEALRLSKRLALKHGRPGHDFVVLETKLGNIAIRRPLDVEVDALEDGNRESLETFAAALAIEPSAEDVRKLMADQAGLAPALTRHAMTLVKVEREEEAKK